jgi:hypothetical protein
MEEAATLERYFETTLLSYSTEETSQLIWRVGLFSTRVQHPAAGQLPVSAR